MDYIEDPPSAEIAAALQATDATLCEHDRNPCYSRCGVRREATRRSLEWSEAGVRHQRVELVPRGPWTVISKAERERWRIAVGIAAIGG